MEMFGNFPLCTLLGLSGTPKFFIPSALTMMGRSCSLKGGLLFVLLVTLFQCCNVTCQSAEFEIDKTSYCRFHPQHTLCIHYGQEPSAQCGSVTARGLEDDEKKLSVDLHNQLRAKLARGEEMRGHPGPQPPAANMMQMVWDTELEIEAQTWADQCITDHDCPECRTVDRFQVGQNLYWFGYQPKGWISTSVNGWFDEVVDFNNTFVEPFFIPKGILVGHFTQLVWAQAWKIGCGKTFYKPENSTRGQILYICNYGLAGNLIGSQMYQIGQPCSACPLGTTCSEEYPGLCSGTPDVPLKIKPPQSLPTGLAGLSQEPSQAPERPALIEVIAPLPLANETNSSCIHRCREDGGCTVKLESEGLISGAVLGSCFPPDFGGDCTGIPELCSACSIVCLDYPGMQVVVDYSQGEPLDTIDIRPLEPEESAVAAGDNEEVPDDDTTCFYDCQDNGGCSVKIQSSFPISGNTLGSCFSPDFGGQCTGIPERCENCNSQCQGKNGQEFAIKALDP